LIRATKPIEILQADLDHRDHQQAVVTLLDAYARDQRIYEAAGFSRSVYVEAAGGALFLSKPLYSCLD